ncbi:MAG: carbohydrate ABC transporter permease [Sphaerochaeta sp.]|nr:carbohydrate ABC transporter permease [Sphaerochaeta sp.]
MKKTTLGIIKRGLQYSILILIAFLALYPFLWMVLYSLKTNTEILVTNPFGLPKEFRFDNYSRAFGAYNIPWYFWNSIVIAVVTVCLTIVMALLFAYAVARMKFKWLGFVRTYILIGMFIPLQIILIPLLILVRDLNLTNTYISIILPYVATGIPFSTLMFYGFFRSIPYAMEESAMLDGAGIMTTFLRIIVPMVQPAIATMVILQFMNSWNEFTLALILISDNAMKTLPLGLLAFQGMFTTDWGAMGAALTIASLPTLIIYLCFSNQVEKAMSAGSAVNG